MRRIKNSATLSALQICTFLFLSLATAAAAEPKAPSSLTNIFAPESTPAKSIFNLSMFVFAITGIIFVVVSTLLIYAVVKFRGKAADSGRERMRVDSRRPEALSFSCHAKEAAKHDRCGRRCAGQRAQDERS